MKKIYLLFIISLFVFPICIIHADEVDNSYVLVSQIDKYYKTITYNNYIYDYNDTIGSKNINSYTIEISKQEYDAAEVQNNIKGDAGVETTYKKLTSQIRQNSTKYRYTATLTWKNFPNTRSYDIIAIGHYSSVQRSNGPYFSLYFCKTDGTCTTTTSHYPQTFSAGTGASFKLPTGSLTTLVATLYFDVVKTNSGTLYSQIAAADYAHATSSVSSSQSMNYTVGPGGITLGSSISSKYDSMSAATATWSGTW